MTKLETVRVCHPDVEGDYIVINRGDFDEDVHDLFQEAERPKRSRSRKQAPQASNGEATLPEGYGIDGGDGGYYVLRGPDGEVIEGPDNGRWHGQDGAIQAARTHSGAA